MCARVRMSVVCECARACEREYLCARETKKELVSACVRVWLRIHGCVRSVHTYVHHTFVYTYIHQCVHTYAHTYIYKYYVNSIVYTEDKVLRIHTQNLFYSYSYLIDHTDKLNNICHCH